MDNLGFSTQHNTVVVATVGQKPALVSSNNYQDFLLSPNTLTLAGCGILLAALAFTSDNKNSKLAKGYWAGKQEIARAKKKGKKQIANTKRNSVCLYINSDENVRQQRNAQWQKLGYKNPVKTKPRDLRKDKKIPTIYVPDAQRGTSVIGAAGTGKTFSVIDPLIRSAIEQSLPTIVYDFKYPAQTKRIAAYAAAHGYKVRVYAPGKLVL